MSMNPTSRGSATPAGLDPLRCVSWNHRHAGFAMLARVAMPSATRQALLERLREAELEAVVLGTCNRTELYWYARTPHDDEVARRAFAEATQGHAAATQNGVVELYGLDAARHLFRIGAGLESLLVGETEVLGQLREAIEAAEQAGTARSYLPFFFQGALRFGRRARAETRIGQGALSVASAAVRHLAQDHSDLSACTAVVIGAGVTGLKVARHLQSERVRRVVVLNRTRARAEEGAAAIGAIPGSLEDLPRWLAEADAVVAAVQVEQPVVRPELLRQALERRDREVPLALVDLSLPRAIHPDCATIAGVVLHDLSGLERIVAGNRALREREIPRVEEMLEREPEIFASQARSSAARPLVGELRRRAEAIRQEELQRALGNGPLGPETMEHVTRRIVDRILQAPSEALRRGDLLLDPQGAANLRALLGLDEPEPAEARDEL
jgi:glutamyl-tRNA reductase